MASASTGGSGTVSPIAGSTTSRNFAGCAVARKTPVARRLRPRQRLLQPEPGDRAVRIQQVPMTAVDRADLRNDGRIVERRADDVAAERLEVVAVHRAHPLEIARRADVHGVGHRLHRRAGLVLARREVLRERRRWRWSRRRSARPAGRSASRSGPPSGCRSCRSAPTPSASPFPQGRSSRTPAAAAGPG